MQFDQVKRREIITLLGGATVGWPLAALGQQSDRIPRLGVLLGYDDPAMTAFWQELEKLGWSDGRAVRIERRYAPAGAEVQALAKELVATKPDVIFAQSRPVTTTLQRETRTIPIVFTAVIDPVGAGFVDGFPRPGGNVTGFTNIEPTIAGKWLELLKEIAPRVNRVAFLFNPATATYAEIFLHPFKAAAVSFAVEAVAAPVHDASALESVVAAQARAPNTGLIVMPDIFLNAHRAEIISLAVRTVSLPFIRTVSSLTSAVCYRTEMTRRDNFRRAAIYVDRILKGDKPSRPAGPGADQVRAGDQPEDRQGARPRRAAGAARPRRRGD